jgi:ribonuclease Z
MRRAARWVLGIAALAVAAALALRSPALQDRLVRRAVERAMAATPDALTRDDALRVLLCGSASPFPHPTRARACVAVFAGGRFWIVDTGPGSWNRLALLGVDGSRIAGVLLTHFHSDHIGDLGEFNMNTWVAGRLGPLRVFGPPGVEGVVAGFAQAYALDSQYRIAHHGADFLPADAGHMAARAIPVPSGQVVVLQEDGLTITAFSVDHAPVAPAYGYRFDYRGRSAVVSGDTAKDAAVVEAARGADLLVHEALASHLVAMIGDAAAAAGRSRVAKIMHDIPSYHTTPVQAAEVANEAGVRLLVFYHLTPPPPLRLIEPVFTRGVSAVRPSGWRLGDDGLLVELPADSSAVEVRQLE